MKTNNEYVVRYKISIGEDETWCPTWMDVEKEVARLYSLGYLEKNITIIETINHPVPEASLPLSITRREANLLFDMVNQFLVKYPKSTVMGAEYYKTAVILSEKIFTLTLSS